MRIKTLVALYFWILEFDDVTCIRSIDANNLKLTPRTVFEFIGNSTASP